MKNIEVGYCVRRDGNVILQDVALVKITDRQIPEIAKYILSDVEYQTGELVCVPSKIYDRITSSVYEDAISKLGKRKDALYGEMKGKGLTYGEIPFEILPEEEGNSAVSGKKLLQRMKGCATIQK